MSGIDVAPSGGIDQSGMRRVNTARVLQALADQRDASTMSDLVRRTGLSRRTLELILTALAADGWVVETSGPFPSTGVGRPKKYYALVAEQALAVAVQIDDGSIEVVVADLRGAERARRRVKVEGSDVHGVLAAAADIALAVVADAGGVPDRVGGVAVGIGGTVSDDGRVITSPVLPEWEGIDVCAPFRRVFDASVRAENDSNLSALAEHWSGAGTDVDTFVMVIPGARLSAGLIIDGAIHRGFAGSAGELIRIRGIDIDRWREHPVANISHPDPEETLAARAILERARDGDPEAREIARDFFAEIAGLLSVIGWLLAPPLIVLRGAFDGVEGIVLELARDELARVGAPDLDVRVARHGAGGAIVGGVRLALDAVESELYLTGQI